MRVRIFASSLLALSACAGGHAASTSPLTCRMAPPGARIALAELFSSEGCDSCPPAERRFNALQPSEQLVPLVWHVDYFDGLGWVDRFALPASAQRQRQLAQAHAAAVVATPQVFVDGVVLPGWRDERAFRSRLLRQAAQQATVALVVQGLTRDGDQLSFDLRTQAAPGVPASYRLHAALLEGGLVSQVTQGENGGSSLHHEHVVRATAEQVAWPAAPSGPWRGHLTLPQPAPSDITLVWWAQDDAARILNTTWARCAL